MTQTTPRPTRHAGPFLAWVWAGLLIVGGLVFLAWQTGLLTYSGSLLLPAGAALVLLAVPFFARWLARRDEWWALITCWVFLALAILLGVIFLNPRAGQVVAMAALAEIAAPFWVVYFVDRRQVWAVITGYTLVGLALLFGLTIFAASLHTVGAFALLIAALPFWLAYLLDRSRWWALVAAGALTVVAVLLLAALWVLQLGNAGLAVSVNVALAVVALAVWLAIRRFDWALWLAIGFALAAIVSIWFPAQAGLALVALTLGVHIAYRQLRAGQRRGQPAQAVPQPPQPAAQPPAPAAPPAPTAPQPAAPPASRDHAAEGEPRPTAPPSSQPVVEFRPIDPFKVRREQADKATDEGKDDAK
jgi:hypothetical protein